MPAEVAGKHGYMSEPMPALIEPMLAVSGGLPAATEEREWGFELKWDGVRAITYIDHGGGPVRATSRLGNDITSRYPELQTLGDVLDGHRAVLDGEVVAFDAEGRPSFELLQQRMHVARRGAVRRLAATVPVVYIAFDVLYLDGRATMSEPYARRRTLLESLHVAGQAVQTPGYFRENAAELLGATRERGLEGLVAKGLRSTYLPGRRARTWRKVKLTNTQEVVIAGWKPGKGARSGGIGSLLVGVYDEGGLRYAGHVGTGFTERMLADMRRLLRPLEIPASPYADEVPREFARDAHWVQPRLVGEVEYASWTKDGRLRAPSWRGLREDVPPEAARRDHP